MRLAIVRQRYTPQGGAERFLEGALEALLERNVAITLFTREWPQTKLQLIEPSIVDPFHVGRLWRDWGFARAATKQIVAGKFNLVQSHELMRTCDIYRPADGIHATWLEERLRDAPAQLRARVAMSPYHRYKLAMERELFASPWLRQVLCNSKMVRDDIKARFGLPDERLPVLYNAVDSDTFSPALASHRERIRAKHRIAQDATLFLLVGSGFRRKGVPAAIAALAGLDADAHLVVVGDDRGMDAFRALAREAGVRERVTFAGFQQDVAPYYGAADAFVLPAVYDSFPDAAMEALATGLPVVTSTRSGAAELVTEHDAGFVCDSRDVASLRAHMGELADPALRARLGANARNSALPLSPAAMTLKLVLIYKELLEASIAHKLAARARAPRPRGGGAAAARRGRARLGDAAVSPGARASAASAQVSAARDHPPALHAVRWRGAIVERARVRARGARRRPHARHAQVAGGRRRARHAAHRRPAVHRPHDARGRLRAGRVHGVGRASADARPVARAHRVLRHLSRRRRRARRVGGGARTRVVGSRPAAPRSRCRRTIATCWPRRGDCTRARGSRASFASRAWCRPRSTSASGCRASACP